MSECLGAVINAANSAPSLAATRGLSRMGLFDPFPPREIAKVQRRGRRLQSRYLQILKIERSRVSEGRGAERKVRDHMLFLLALKQDDLIKSSATCYMSRTKLLLLRGDSRSNCSLVPLGAEPTWFSQVQGFSFSAPRHVKIFFTPTQQTYNLFFSSSLRAFFSHP